MPDTGMDVLHSFTEVLGTGTYGSPSPTEITDVLGTYRYTNEHGTQYPYPCPHSGVLKVMPVPRVTNRRTEHAKVLGTGMNVIPVSYTHLTLPTKA